MIFLDAKKIRIVVGLPRNYKELRSSFAGSTEEVAASALQIRTALRQKEQEKPRQVPSINTSVVTSRSEKI